MTCACGGGISATTKGRWCAECVFRAERIKAKLVEIQDQLGAESCTLVVHLKNGARVAIRPGFEMIAA